MRYTATFSVAGVNTANTVLANLKAGADRCQLLEVGIFTEVLATAAHLGLLQRMAAVGTGAITSIAGVPHDVGDSAAMGVVETAWATARPTLTANTVMRRGQHALSVGSGFIWNFMNMPLFIPANGGICLVQANASGATLGIIGGYFTWDE